MSTDDNNNRIHEPESYAILYSNERRTRFFFLHFVRQKSWPCIIYICLTDKESLTFINQRTNPEHKSHESQWKPPLAIWELHLNPVSQMDSRFISKGQRGRVGRTRHIRLSVLCVCMNMTSNAVKNPTWAELMTHQVILWFPRFARS